MRLPTVAGMWWAGEGNTWPLSVIWNLGRPSRSRRRNKTYQRKNVLHRRAGKKTSPDLFKKLQRNYKKGLAKWFQKSYNMVTERAQALLAHEIFFFLFLRYRVSRASSSGCSPSQLLPDTAQAVSRFVCKKARPFSGRAFLHLPGVLLRQKRKKADEKKADGAQDSG